MRYSNLGHHVARRVSLVRDMLLLLRSAMRFLKFANGTGSRKYRANVGKAHIRTRSAYAVPLYSRRNFLAFSGESQC